VITEYTVVLTASSPPSSLFENCQRHFDLLPRAFAGYHYAQLAAPFILQFALTPASGRIGWGGNLKGAMRHKPCIAAKFSTINTLFPFK
jgi:hypothetical protein